MKTFILRPVSIFSNFYETDRYQESGFALCKSFVKLFCPELPSAILAKFSFNPFLGARKFEYDNENEEIKEFGFLLLTCQKDLLQGNSIFYASVEAI